MILSMLQTLFYYQCFTCVVLTKKKFLDAINLKIPTNTMLKSSSNEVVLKYLYKIGYQEKLKGVLYSKKRKLPAVWQLTCHYIIQCIFGLTGGTVAMGKQLLYMFWSIFINEPVDYGAILWDDFITYG